MDRYRIILKDHPAADGLETSEDARKLIRSLGQDHVALDFSGIDFVGEDFARELLVGWRRIDPRVTVKIINACENVENTIHKVLRQ